MKFKAPKIAGIKKYTVYMSKKASGYKKVKTIKPGKSFTLKKFGGKLKKNKKYYYKIVINGNKKIYSRYVLNKENIYFLIY